MHNTAGVEHKNNVLMEYSAWRYLAANVALYKNLLAHSGLQVDGALLKRVQHEKRALQLPLPLCNSPLCHGCQHVAPSIAPLAQNYNHGPCDGHRRSRRSSGRSLRPQQQPKCLHLLFCQVVLCACLLAASSCFACRKEDTVIRTACEERPGYETLADAMVIYGTGNFFPTGREGSIEGSTAAAFAVCNSDPDCITFNNYGYTGNLGSMVFLATGTEFICTYFKKPFPRYPGYTLKPFMEWFPSEDAVVVVEASAEAARARCDAEPDCSAWASSGECVLGQLAPDVFAISDSQVAFYVKKECPDKLGFEAHAHQLLTHPAGCNGTGNSSHSGGGEPFVDRLPYVRAAEAFCRMNNNCSAFSSDGSYMIGGPVELEPKPGICTYRKQLCPPMIGFTAFEGVSFRVQYPPDSTPASSTSSPSSLTDVYQVCRQDPACVAFDNLHRYWSITAPSSVELCGPGNTNPVPGACLYYKNPDGVTWSI